MKKDMCMRILTSLIIALVISIPFYPSYALGQDNNYVAEYLGTDAPPYDVSYIEHLDVPESPDACIAKAHQTSDLVDAFDNDIIQTLTQIVDLITTLCTVADAVESILSALNTVLGDKSGCCMGLPWTAGVCEAINKIYTIWNKAYSAIRPICCIATCGVCKGAGDCGGGVLSGGVNLGVSLDPADSIYVSMACLCIPGILLHVKKLKLIYQTHNCCIKEACNKGLSTESCERELDVQTCMFWEGGVVKAIVGIILNVIVGFISKYLAKNATQYFSWMKCVLAWWDIVNVPKTWQSIQQNLDDLDETFTEPNCGDLGFDKLDDVTFEEEPFQVRLEDTDGDGKYDKVERISAGSKASKTVGKITGLVTDAQGQDEEDYDGERILPEKVFDLGTDFEQTEPTIDEQLKDLDESLEQYMDLRADFERRNPDFELKVGLDADDTVDDRTLEDVREEIDRITNPQDSAEDIPEGYVPPNEQEGMSFWEKIKTAPGRWYEKNFGKQEKGFSPDSDAEYIAPTSGDSSTFTSVEYNNDGTWVYASGDKEGQEVPPDALPRLTNAKAPLTSQKVKGNNKAAAQSAVSTIMRKAIVQFLQPTIDEKIKDMCEDKEKSSVAESSTPTDQTIAGKLGFADTCEPPTKKTTVTAQASHSGGEYSYSFFALSCTQNLNIQVKLENSRIKLIEAANLEIGETLLKSGHINDTHNFTQICIHTNDNTVGEEGVVCSAIS